MAATLIPATLFYVQKQQIDRSPSAKLKYHTIGRAAALATTLWLVIETVGRLALAALASVATILTLGLSDKTILWFLRDTVAARAIFVTIPACLAGVFAPKLLHDRLMATPFMPLIRENRLRIDPKQIEKKLKKEVEAAEHAFSGIFNGKFNKVGQLGNIENVPNCKAAVASYQGKRPKMEDAHLIETSELKINKETIPIRIYGIFDGHVKDDAALFLKKHFKEVFEQTLIELNPNGLSDLGIWNALKTTFIRLNKQYTGEAGSTATVAIVLQDHLWVANVGDSRTLLVDGGGNVRQLSEDAWPSMPKYGKSITDRNGFVSRPDIDRVNGIIATARAIGDHFVGNHPYAYPTPHPMSARPKITKIPMPKNEKGPSHLVLVCDGIHDVATTQQIGRKVFKSKGLTLGERAATLVHCAYEAGSQDNLSAMVVEI